MQLIDPYRKRIILLLYKHRYTYISEFFDLELIDLFYVISRTKKKCNNYIYLGVFTL